VRGEDARGHELLKAALAGCDGEAKDHRGILDGVDRTAVGGVEVEEAVLAFLNGKFVALEADYGGGDAFAAVAGKPVPGARDEAFLVGAGEQVGGGGRGSLVVDFGFGGGAGAIVGLGFCGRGFALDGGNGHELRGNGVEGGGSEVHRWEGCSGGEWRGGGGMMECGEGCDLCRQCSDGGDEEIGLVVGRGWCGHGRKQTVRAVGGQFVEGGDGWWRFSVGVVVVAHGSVENVNGVDEATELPNGDSWTAAEGMVGDQGGHELWPVEALGKMSVGEGSVADWNEVTEDGFVGVAEVKVGDGAGGKASSAEDNVGELRGAWRR